MRIPSRNQTCSRCGHKASPQAGFCPQCGNPLAGGIRKCGACQTENRADATSARSAANPWAKAPRPTSTPTAGRAGRMILPCALKPMTSPNYSNVS